MAIVAAGDGDMQATTICAVVSEQADRRFGFAVFDSDKRSFRICEYLEDSHASRTEALLLQVQPRSCCIALRDNEDVKKITTVATSCGVPLTQLKSYDFKQVDLEQDLLRLLSDTEGCGLGRHLEEQRQKQGMRALAALLAHGGLVNEPAHFGACSLSLYPLRSFLYLDKAAFSALNVLPRPDESLRASTSLFGFLNRCRTPFGTRRLRQWLTQPLTSHEDIRKRHDVVEAFSSAETLLRQVEGYFRHVPDLERLATRLHRVGTKSTAQKATLEDLVSMYHCIRGTTEVLSALESYAGDHQAVMVETMITPLKACIADFGNFCALIEKTVDLEQAQQRVYCIHKAFDAELATLAGKRDKVRDAMEEHRKEVDKDLGLQGRGNERTVALVDCPEGQALRVTKKNQGAVKDAKGKIKYRTLQIKKQEFIFTTPELDKFNKGFNEAVTAYDKKSSELVGKAVGVAATYRPVVERLAECLGAVDVLAAFARAALLAPCQFVRPKINTEGRSFEVKGLTHPLVVANSDKAFIANDLNMDKDESRLHLITGPNMGGKSTYIRSVALLALLNQIGSFVPCQSATLPVFDSIMCRVGASDMQLRGISTFMAEMLEASCILNTASEQSLVIIDELGRGTSTSDGFGIAWAIARHLVDRTRCFTLFATHFHELGALAEEVGAVKNRHATAAVCPSTGSLTFLYNLADGVAGQSYGAHCAEVAGFPAKVVESARVRAEHFEASSEFGRAAKRPRTEATQTANSETAYVMASTCEDDFVKRALEKAAALPMVAVGGGAAIGGS